jgi:hypothetical protein
MRCNFDNLFGDDSGFFESQYNRVQNDLSTLLLKITKEEQLNLKIDREVGAIIVAGVTFKVSADFLDAECTMKRVVILIFSASEGGLIRLNKVWATGNGEISLSAVRVAFNELRLRS